MHTIVPKQNNVHLHRLNIVVLFKLLKVACLGILFKTTLQTPPIVITSVIPKMGRALLEKVQCGACGRYPAFGNTNGTLPAQAVQQLHWPNDHVVGKLCSVCWSLKRTMFGNGYGMRHCMLWLVDVGHFILWASWIIVFYSLKFDCAKTVEMAWPRNEQQ